MANGNLQDIGYEDILSGSKYGGDPLSSIMKALTGTAATGGYFGTGQSDLSSSELSNYFSTTTPEEQDIYDLMLGTSDYWHDPEEEGSYADTSNYGTGQMGKGQLLPQFGSGEEWNRPNIASVPSDHRPKYNLENLISSLKGKYGEGGEYYDTESDFHGGMKSLLGMLQGAKLPSLTQTYSQNVGDIGREVQSDLQSLQTQFSVGGKGRRYGTVGSGGRNLAMGGRDKYLSDYYGLKDKQGEMQSNLRKQLEEDFMGNIGGWMQYNPNI